MDIKYFNGITPKFIDYKIEKFCKKINYNAKPQYIDVFPMENSIINECVQNVQNYIKKYGGKAILGWTIWLHPHCMIEAEFHEICMTTSGQLIDVTPHKDGNKNILFLEDPSIEYSSFQINNIRKNISNSILIDKCIKNWDKIFEIMNKGDRKYKHGLLNIYGEDANEIIKLQEEIKALLFQYYKDLKLKPNDLCICGSNLKYINCCKNKIS